ncbi:FKBP-type peptidyl-prolyl cis-trans isomerase [Shewanella surugensis]|uniref:FKBP-type peptidyl-prolyl cis-trans isomerase n=1 Tax=Shewanella surugensis TaxID=212020 RepID=UPI0035E2BE66
MKITQQCAVTIHYQLKDDEDRVIENSFDNEPMLYLHGTESMIPGLEAELEGKIIGDKIETSINAEDGYGEYHDGLRQEVPLNAFGDVEDIVPGMRFIAETEMGQRPVQVVEVKDDVAVVDGNHPLAGQTLHFNVEVIDVREATEEELAHGHVHTSGSCENQDTPQQHEYTDGCSAEH